MPHAALEENFEKMLKIGGQKDAGHYLVIERKKTLYTYVVKWKKKNSSAFAERMLYRYKLERIFFAVCISGIYITNRKSYTYLFLPVH